MWQTPSNNSIATSIDMLTPREYRKIIERTRNFKESQWIKQINKIRVFTIKEIEKITNETSWALIDEFISCKRWGSQTRINYK